MGQHWDCCFVSKKRGTDSLLGGSVVQTGASLKLTILNPACRIWTMVAGGGASVIYADTVRGFPLPCLYPQVTQCLMWAYSSHLMRLPAYCCACFDNLHVIELKDL